MTPVKRNIVANYLGQVWAGVMALAFIPLYIQYLGVEGFGVIGLFTVMQAWLTLFDMGMTPTLNREMARFTAGAHSLQSVRDLLFSLQIVCFVAALLLGFAIFAGSGYLAHQWLNAEQISPEALAKALGAMGVVLALRLCEGIYRGALLGLQRQVLYNICEAGFASLRYAGAVGVLAWISPTIFSFFVWQMVVSLLSLGVLAVAVHRVLPRASSPPRFSTTALAGISTFAGGMLGISILALLLTQMDKLLLSRLLPLGIFGYYMVASTAAGALYMMTGPVTQAVYPRMIELLSRGASAELIDVYHQGAQLVTVLTAPAALVAGFFAGGVLFAWSGDTVLAANGAPIFTAIVLGTFLNVLMWMPYQCQLAHGWTGLTLKVNAVAVLLLVPAIIWVVPRHGAIGAAWVWGVLNAGYVLIVTQLMHRRILTAEKWRWYLRDLLMPVGGAFAVVAVATVLQPDSYASRIDWLVFLLVTGGVALATAAVLANRVRPRLLKLLDRSVRWRYS